MGKLRHLDLFTGILGFSLGLEKTGKYETVGCCEIEPYAQAVILEKKPSTPCWPDIVKLNNWLEKALTSLRAAMTINPLMRIEEDGMKSRDFCYWLQGYFEIAGKRESIRPVELDEAQIKMIQAHLALVFKHEIDPEAGGQEIQDVLNEIHNGKKDKPTIGGKDPVTGMLYRC